VNPRESLITHRLSISEGGKDDGNGSNEEDDVYCGDRRRIVKKVNMGR
jgi:hypothetical protein